MKSFDPDDKYDQEHCARLSPEPWMLEQLKLNPSYVHWGPGDDFMEGYDKKGWTGAGLYRWKEHTLEPNTLNEVVNFYFEIERDHTNCHCDGGYSNGAQEIRDNLSDSGVYNGDNVTDDQLRHLHKNNRIFKARELPQDVPIKKLRQVFEAEHSMMRIDSINMSLLVEFECARAEVPVRCPDCEGHGYTYNPEPAYLSLVYWVILPRKGASHGAKATHITREDLPAVFNFLAAAARRNFERFAQVEVLASTR